MVAKYTLFLVLPWLYTLKLIFWNYILLARQICEVADKIDA